jgi:hypothetical protein
VLADHVFGDNDEMTSLRFDDGAARHDWVQVISSLKPRSGEVIPSFLFS